MRLFLAGLWGLAPLTAAAAQETADYKLYFPRSDHPSLGFEERRIEKTGSLAGDVTAVVKALAAGPRTGLKPALPPGRTLRQVFLGPDGTVFVDLAVAAGAASLGVQDEALSLWAIVNTLGDNFSEVKAVKVLLGGDEAPDYFGHLDISRPLQPDHSLVEKDGGR
ncbi:MAG: GerMN domain-containing protein [Thermodesulfobacteriota bacterium]